jgi:CheY-like chemotaxis protein
MDTDTQVRTSNAVSSILVVDDDEDFREMVCQYARHLGSPAWAATNGLEALWIVKHERPALVLLDLRMPRLNGFDTIRHIQKFDPAIRIVIVTGDGSDETRQRVEQLEMPLLLKPVALETVRDLLVPGAPGRTRGSRGDA